MQIITTDKIAKSNGPYSQGYTHNGFFFTAGQIGVEPSDGELHVHTIEGQTDRACRNIGIMLEAAGTSFDKVIKANCFIADMDDFDAFNQVYARYFTSRPARTCVAVKHCPNMPFAKSKSSPHWKTRFPKIIKERFHHDLQKVSAGRPATDPPALS